DQLQRVLTRASLLERVVPAYVQAILSVEPDELPLATLTSLLDQAEAMGLISRTAVGASIHRFHPLLRTYLQHELELTTTVSVRKDMHLRVAEAAETDDWLVAAEHYIEADHPADAMRVIAESATVALGNGDFGGVMNLLARMPEQDP